MYDERMLDLSTEADHTRHAFASTERFIRQAFIAAEIGGGWRQFLQEPGPATVGGTACVAASLLTLGVPAHDDQIVAAADFLASQVEPDGGWTKPDLAGKISLTLATCLTVNALVRIGRPEDHPLVAGGLQWLTTAQNDDGGWGNLPQDRCSDVTSSAYAVRTLVAADPHRVRSGDALRRGARWVADQRGWTSIAHAAHAAEALLATGTDPHDLRDLRDQIHTAVRETGTAPWLEQYPFPRDYPGDLPRHSRLSWTHLTAERALIGLLRLDVDPTDPTVRELVADVRRRHTDGAFWESQTVPGAAPSWAILEATNALSLHLDRLTTVGQLGVFRDVCRDLSSRLADDHRRAAELAARCADLEERVVVLERKLSKASVFATQAAKAGRWLRSPAVQTAAVLVITMIALVAYLVAADAADTSDRLVSIATILAPALALLEIVRRRRAK